MLPWESSRHLILRRHGADGSLLKLICSLSQVKSSQVKFKMAVSNPPPLVPIAGASDREGRSRRNRHHWIALSRGIIPIVLFLIIAAPQGFNNMPFLEVYSTAMRIRSRPTTGAIGGLREGCSGGPRCR